MQRNLKVTRRLKRLIPIDPAPNLAVTRERIFSRGALSLVAPGLRQRTRCKAVLREGAIAISLASARPRSGISAWEVHRLHLRGRGRSKIPDLLEQLVSKVGHQGGKRLFLRIPTDAGLEKGARKAGFFPIFQEMLLEGWSEGIRPGELPEGMIAPANRHHNYSLFQLYCATTPLAVRQSTGMTLSEWEDSLEPLSGKHTELTCEINGRTSAWLGIKRRRGVNQIEGLVHPDEGWLTSCVLDYTHSYKGVQIWLVPTYHSSLIDSLQSRGFRATERYTMLIRPIATPVEETSWAAMRVAT